MLSDIEQDREAGAPAVDRVQALKRAKRRDIRLSVIAAIAAIGAAVPGSHLHLPSVVVLTLVPLAALYFLYKEPVLYALIKPKRDPRAELFSPLFIPAIGLTLASAGTHFVSMRPLLPSMAVVALALVACLYVAGRRGPQTRGFYAAVVLYAVIFSFGLVATCDTLLDRANPTVGQAQLLGKHIVHGKIYWLDFAAWGPLKSPGKVAVSYGVYETAEPGDTVCFALHPGALRAAWYLKVGCDMTEQLQTTP